MRPALLLLAAAAASAGEYTTYIGDQNTWSIAQVLADASGNTYVAGSRTFDLSYDPLHPTPFSEAIVAKIDTTGKTVLFAGIGGKGNDTARAVALDPSGNIYLAGTTSSPNFPLKNALFGAFGRGFITKFTPNASDILWSTYFPEPVTAIVVDATGVYVTGTTESNSFPTTPGLPNLPTSFRVYGAYLTKLSPAGDRILYSTVISGTEKNCGCCSSCFTSIRGASAVGVGVDSAGNAYFGGNSDVTDLPGTAGSLLPKGAGAWVAKVNAAGTALAYLTYLTAGGVTLSPFFTPDTSMGAFAVDPAGHAFASGATVAKDIPVTPGAFQSAPAEGYALALNPSGSGVVWATYLGGRASTATVDPAGNFWVAGRTHLTEFPNANGWSTGDDYIVGFNATGALSYSSRYPTGTATFTFAVDSAKLLHIGEPGGVLSAIVPDQHPAVRPWFIGPNGGQIAPSQIVSIYGPHIGGQPVTVNGIAAPVLYSSDQQLNAIVPSEIESQTKATIRLGNGPDFTAAVLPAIPQIFAVVNQDGTVNSEQNPAKVGSVMTMWVGGFGAVDGPNGAVATTADPYRYSGAVYANGQPVQELYSGTAPGLVTAAGQINFVAPDAPFIQFGAKGRVSAQWPIFTTR